MMWFLLAIGGWLAACCLAWYMLGLSEETKVLRKDKADLQVNLQKLKDELVMKSIAQSASAYRKEKSQSYSVDDTHEWE